MESTINPSIFSSLAKAQASFAPIIKSKTGQIGNLKYKYAQLSDIIDCIKKPLSDNDISFYQCLSWNDGHNFLDTKLSHGDGQSIMSRYSLPDSSKMSPQEFGKVLTYARRYSLAAITGVEAEDDTDGALPDNKINNASGTSHKRPTSTSTPRGNSAEDTGSWVFPKGKSQGKSILQVYNETDGRNSSKGDKLTNLYLFFVEKGMDKGWVGEFIKNYLIFMELKQKDTDQDQDHSFNSQESEDIPWEQ